MTLFEGLVLAHLAGDWLFQTEWMAHNKRSNWLALVAHLLVYHSIIGWVMAFCFHLPLMNVGIALGFLIVTHAILDRQNFVKWYVKTMRLYVDRQPERWFLIAIDQTFHLLLLGAISIYLTHLPH